MSNVKKLSNDEVIKELKEVLAAMEVKDVNRFRIRAYQNAIVSIENMTQSVLEYWENARLSEIPGVGAALSQHLDELFTKGDVKDFALVKKDLPDGMFALIGLRGIGAKKAFKLADAFKLNDRKTAVEKLKKLAETKKIQNLEGFGEKSERDILEAVSEAKMHKSEKKRMLLVTAETIALRVMKYLEENEFVEKIDTLGSLRRREATVGDLDIIVGTANSEDVIKHFVDFPEIEDVLSKGDKKAIVVLKNDVQVDLRTVEPKAYGAMVQYNTGSKLHNIVLRTHALEMGLSLNEYGIKNKKTKELEEYETEEQFYRRLGLQLIPPELRQGKQEVDLAALNKLPKLVELSEIKGDVHVHTDFSDGVDTLEEMHAAALELGYSYLGIADHAPSVVSRGEDEVMGIISTQRSAVESLNASNSTLKLLYGYEVNILADATISLPNKFLEKLDYAIGSIHTALDQDKDQITKRLIAAIEHPHIDIIGHPSGRLINERKSCEVNWTKVFDAAKANNKTLEINAQPSRLDLAEDLVTEAIKKGVKLIVNTDAHDTTGLLYMRYGVDVARRGWAGAENIINTFELADFNKKLR